jgi:hypothetical protein
MLNGFSAGVVLGIIGRHMGERISPAHGYQLMPKGAKGQKCPANVIGNAVKEVRIARFARASGDVS